MKINFQTSKIGGSRITLRWSATNGIYDYANTLLVLFNWTRTNYRLLKLSNNSEFDIYIDCLKEHEAEVVEWLKQFGEIIGVESILIVTIYNIDYDYYKYADITVIVEE